MFWLDVDLAMHTATLHTGKCIHIDPMDTDRKGLNEMKIDGGWFNFESVGEVMRFFKVKKMNGEVAACLLCKPLNEIGDITMAQLDISTPKTGCDACIKEVGVVDTKSSYRHLLNRLLDPYEQE